MSTFIRSLLRTLRGEVAGQSSCQIACAGLFRYLEHAIACTVIGHGSDVTHGNFCISNEQMQHRGALHLLLGQGFTSHSRRGESCDRFAH